MRDDRLLGGADQRRVLSRIVLRRLPLLDRPSGRQIPVDEIVRRGLVGHHVGPDAAPDELGQDVGGVAEQSHRHGRPLGARIADERERVVEILRLPVEIARGEAHLDPTLLALDREHRCAGQRRGQRLRAAHPAQARGQDPLVGELTAAVLAAGLGERLVGALDDALAADVDPRAGGHLAEHHEALAVELVEVLPRRPFRHQVRVGEQHARRIAMRLEHADRLARLDQQRFVVVELASAPSTIASKHSQLRAARPMPP